MRYSALFLVTGLTLSACVPTVEGVSQKPSNPVTNFYAEARAEAQRIDNNADYEVFLTEYGKGCYIIRSKYGWSNNPTCWRIYTELVTAGERKGFSADPHNLSEAKRAKSRAEAAKREAARQAAPRPTQAKTRHPSCSKPSTAGYAVAVSRGLC